MTLKIREIYSTNFDSKRRKRNKIRFLVFHYTGMRKEEKAIQRLIKIQSEVGTHYFIKRNGEILRMVPDLYTAWHAGVSKWGKYKLLNKNSIGIEISNPGHQFGYINFSKKQINSTVKLSKILIKKYRIKKKHILGHSDIAPDRKMDPGEKFPWKNLYKKNVGIWHNLNDKRLINLRKKYISNKQKTLFMKKLVNFGYPSKSINIKSKIKYNKLLVKAFQRHFRPELVNGRIDLECLSIVKNLTSLIV